MTSSIKNCLKYVFCCGCLSKQQSKSTQNPQVPSQVQKGNKYIDTSNQKLNFDKTPETKKPQPQPPSTTGTSQNYGSETKFKANAELNQSHGSFAQQPQSKVWPKVQEFIIPPHTTEQNKHVITPRPSKLQENPKKIVRNDQSVQNPQSNAVGGKVGRITLPPVSKPQIKKYDFMCVRMNGGSQSKQNIPDDITYGELLHKFKNFQAFYAQFTDLEIYKVYATFGSIGAFYYRIKDEKIHKFADEFKLLEKKPGQQNVINRILLPIRGGGGDEFNDENEESWDLSSLFENDQQ